MRNSDRIERILEKFKKYWNYNPDYRFEQIVSNINSQIGRLVSDDIFYIEDDLFEEGVDAMIKQMETK